jgi:hypothetical protein
MPLHTMRPERLVALLPLLGARWSEWRTPVAVWGPAAEVSRRLHSVRHAHGKRIALWVQLGEEMFVLDGIPDSLFGECWASSCTNGKLLRTDIHASANLCSSVKRVRLRYV